MLKKLHGLLGTLTIAGLLILTACPQPDGDPGTGTGGGKINLSALQAKIAEAELAKEGVLTATQASDVAQGRKWVTAGVMEAFTTAIYNAKIALGADTQQKVDSAVKTLSAEINAFNGMKQIGTKTSGFTQADLNALIDDANTAKSGVAASTDGKDVSLQEYWVTPSVMDALDSAINAAYYGGNIDSAYNSLNTALINFIANKKPGTGASHRTITISGLDVPDGTEIAVGLFETDQIIVNEQPGILGNGTILNKTVTVTLYGSNNTSWIGNGSYYAAFSMHTDNPKIYISKSKISFSNTSPNAAKIFSDFKQYVYRFTLGEFAEQMGITIPASGITLDEWCQNMAGMTYAQMLEAGYIQGPLYKNEGLSQPFSGSDRLTATTVIYSEYNLMGGSNPGTKIGEITGTIILTNIPNPKPRVSISAYGSDWYNYWSSRSSQINLNSVTGTSATLNWSIPLYDNDDFSPSEGNFYLYVQPSGSMSGFSIDIPGSKYIESANANVGSLGSVNIGYITLSGTLNVTLDGQPVPRVEIEVWSEYDGWLGDTLLTSPGPNAPWSISLRGFGYSTPVYFNVHGYSTNGYYEQLFERTIRPNPPVNISNQNIPNISLNLGNIPNPNTPVNPTSLTADTWKDDSITNSGDVKWYSISVTNGTRYYLWWNDSYRGDDTKTLDIDVYAYNSSQHLISLADNDSAWYDPVSFTASSSDTVYVRVRAYDGDYRTGTYAIVYNTSGTKPGGSEVVGGTFTLTGIPSTYNGKYAALIAQDDYNEIVLVGAQSISLISDTADVIAVQISNGSVSLPMWRMTRSGTFISYSGNNTVAGTFMIFNSANTYQETPIAKRSFGSIAFSSGSVAKIWSQGTDTVYIVSYDLNGGAGTTPSSQTESYGTIITLPDGSGFSRDDYTFNGWTDESTRDNYNPGSSYTVTTTTTLYARWISNALGGEVNPIPLTEDDWTDGTIDYSTPNREVWYSFNVTSGTTYYVWWNDYDGDGSYPLDVKVDAYNSNGSPDFSEDNGWDGSHQIIASSTGTVKLKVYPYYKYDTGTFAIVYSTSDTMP
ncbi:MAG: InlB B-repeat-containing protein [Treponema sp.]|jgi:uncharacterized repeat protein (TIGR02543 family)|nr:InlB B-repeat-containing protein [Treponema sp.]